MRKRIALSALIALTIFYVGGHAYVFATHSWLTHEIITSGGSARIEESGPTDLKRGMGFVTPLPITNLPTIPSAGMVEVASVIFPDATVSYFSFNSPTEPPSRYRLAHRKVTNLFGGHIIEYWLSCNVLKIDDFYHCHLSVTGGGSAGYTAQFNGRVSGDTLIVDISETMFGDHLSYALELDLKSGNTAMAR